MWRFLCAAILVLGTAGLSAAEEWGGNCAAAIVEGHGVWRTPREFVPFFADLELTAYLASLGREASEAGRRPALVLPVYSPQPLHFRRGHSVFVSTGLLLSLESEADLRSRLAGDLRLAARDRGGYEGSYCSSLVGEQTFPEMQTALAEKVRRYEAWFLRGLRRR